MLHHDRNKMLQRTTEENHFVFKPRQYSIQTLHKNIQAWNFLTYPGLMTVVLCLKPWGTRFLSLFAPKFGKSCYLLGNEKQIKTSNNPLTFLKHNPVENIWNNFNKWKKFKTKVE